MSDKTKAKKIDLRLSDEMYEEITLISWVTGRKRSELLRMMIGFFVEHGSIEFDELKMGWAEFFELACESQKAKGLTFEQICDELSGRTARQTQLLALELELEIDEQLRDELKGFAEIYAKNAIDAFKKHSQT